MATTTATRKPEPKSAKSPAASTDAIVMLRDDHKRVDAMFKQYEWDPLESTCRHASLSIL